MSSPLPLVENAPAKVNLTLRVLGRRVDGYHEIESLVAFADVGDRLSFSPGDELALTVHGPSASQAGDGGDNLVLKAAHALATRISGIRLGAFDLEKLLPVAAGLGGGSADAGAALRLLARANGISGGDLRLYEAARAVGADVPVCLDSRPRLMRGIGEILSLPIALPPTPALLVNPGVAVPTKAVFAGWAAAGGHTMAFDMVAAKTSNREKFLQLLMAQANDLETAAFAVAPVIVDVLVALRALPGSRLARMSGSGATCFALFSSAAKAIAAGQILRSKHPDWWVRATSLGGAGARLPAGRLT